MEEREGDGTCIDRMSNFICSTNDVYYVEGAGGLLGCNSLHRHRIDQRAFFLSRFFFLFNVISRG